MKLALVVFSATGNTAKFARKIKGYFKSLGMDTDVYDITARANRQEPMDFKAYQGVVFGFPVHSLRAPKVVRDWLCTLDGHGKKAALFFTFGGFSVHPAHHSTQKLLADSGFNLVASAQFPGAHTFNLGGWQAFADRPNATDFTLAKEYAGAVVQRFTGKDTGVLGDLDPGNYSQEQLDVFESLRFKIITRLPGRKDRDCRMCMACENACPAGAMDAVAGRADPEKCIACLGCVANCPDKALSINDTRPFWAIKLDMGKTSEQELNQQQGKIYL